MRVSEKQNSEHTDSIRTTYGQHPRHPIQNGQRTMNKPYQEQFLFAVPHEHSPKHTARIPTNANNTVLAKTDHTTQGLLNRMKNIKQLSRNAHDHTTVCTWESCCPYPENAGWWWNRYFTKLVGFGLSLPTCTRCTQQTHNASENTQTHVSKATKS